MVKVYLFEIDGKQTDSCVIQLGDPSPQVGDGVWLTTGDVDIRTPTPFPESLLQFWQALHQEMDNSVFQAHVEFL